MLAHGNGSPQKCVDNLMRMIRGEVPFERVKGLDPALIDRPSSTAQPQLAADAEWLVETYEPRAKIENISMGSPDGINGRFGVQVQIVEKL